MKIRLGIGLLFLAFALADPLKASESGEWQFSTNVEAASWDGGEISLPNLKPGDAAWTSDAKVKPGTIVKLFTPTGYDVADSAQ